MRTLTESYLAVLLVLVLALTGLAGAANKPESGTPPVEAKPVAAPVEAKLPPATPDPEEVLVTMNGVALKRKHIEYMQNNRFARGEVMGAQRWIDIKSKADQARRIGIDKEEENAFILTLVVDYFLSGALDKHEEKKIPEATEEELRQKYQEKIETYKNPTRVTLQHITVTDRDRAVKLIEEIKSGGSFEKLVRAHSIAKDKNRRGRLNSITIDKLEQQLGPKVVEAVTPAAKNDILGPLLGKGGFEIIKIIDIRPAHVTPFEDARRPLEFEMRDERVRLMREIIMEEAKANANIVKSKTLHDLESELERQKAAQQKAARVPKPPKPPKVPGEVKMAPPEK